MKTLYKLLAIVMIFGLVFTALPIKAVQAEAAEVNPAMQAGADRLTALQNNDGGWDWDPADDGNPNSVSPLNTIGPIGMGLAQAYRFTGDSGHRAALQKVGDLLLSKVGNFSPSDGELAAKLDEVFGGSTYKDYVTANFYDLLAAGTYYRIVAPTVFYDTAALVNRIRTSRLGSQANMAAWDIGLGIVGASLCGADTSAWIDGAKAELNELDSDSYYDVIGLAGALYGLAFVNEEFDPTAGDLAAASNLADLAAILAGYQIAGGGFAWNSGYVTPDDGNETIQETSYAILALNEVDRALYLDEVRGAADYMLSVQLATGGWENYPGDGENNEITGEALWAIAASYPMPEVWVCETGDCGHPGFEFATIQTGINAVDPGGIVHVLPGTYAEAITLNKPDITVKSTDGAANTFIVTPAGALTTGVTIVKNMGNVTFDGFTVNNFTESGIIQGMSQREGTAAIIKNNIVTPASNYLRNGIQVTGNGSIVEGNVINGARLTETWGSSAIIVTNGSDILVKNNVVNGGATGVDVGISILNYNVGLVSGISIEGNVINDASSAISIQGGPDAGGVQKVVSGVTISNNDFGNSNTGIDISYVELAGTNVFERNNFAGNKTYVAIWVEGYPPYNYPGAKVTGSLDASPNWFGSISGPDVLKFYDDNLTDNFSFTHATYTPWCGDAACSFLNPQALALSDDLQAAIDAAPDGMIIYVPGPFIYSQAGGYDLDNDRVTIILGDGVVIQNESPCFNVGASYTRILAEPGAKCIPTNGANGIDVAAGVTGVTVEGLEITKGETATGDGIAFAGAVTDIVLVDNWIHGLDGDGISFATAPAGVVDIHGNLFQNNAGNGIDADAFTVPAEYNSWGHVEGAAAGDGASAGVDADPFTHVDLYLVPSGTPWANQVVNGGTITYAVKAHMVNVNAADFVLKYDPALLSVASVIPGTDFVGLLIDDEPEVYGSLVDATEPGELHFLGFKMEGTVDGDITLFTVTFNANAAGTSALNFDEATDLFGMPGVGSSSNIYAAALTDGSVKVIDLPVISSPDMRGYFLTGEQREYSVSVNNPSTGGAYSHVRFQFKIIGAALSDLTSLEYFEVMDSTWKNLPLTPDGLGNLVGYFGPSVGMPMPAGYSGTSLFRLTAAVAGEYPTEITLIDFDSMPANFVLSTLTETTYVFNKPVITTTGLTGDHQGLTVDFTLNINNMSAMVDPYMSTAVTFLVDLDLPEGTELTTPGGLVTCDATGCQFPVTLAAGANAISLTAAFTGTMTVTSVPVTLFDDLADPERELATASFGPVAVFDNVPAVLGTVSMQGRTTRAGVPVTLTAVTVPYGPYLATSIEQISNNLSFANLAEGSYTITTNQPRYLNITAALGKTVAISDAKTTLSSLELKGGNAYWTDNLIDIFDAVAVGTTYGTSGNVDGDVNFDGKVNIQDLALVGGNYRLTSADVYGSWVP